METVECVVIGAGIIGLAVARSIALAGHEVLMLETAGAINEDHYIQQIFYDPGTYTFTQEEMGTRYTQMTVRTFVDPNDPKDIEELHKAQDGLKVIQESRGRFEVPDWNQAQSWSGS